MTERLAAARAPGVSQGLDLPFTPRERDVIQRHATPPAVQRWLHGLRYNAETGGGTLRSFRGVVRYGLVHCLEAALAAAAILEQHGYPPLLLSFESVDQLDHVLYVFREAGHWGAVARSRDPGLHGRKPVYRSARDLARSYMDPYVDFTGRITGYVVADLRELGRYDWRLSRRNVWRVERWLLEMPHTPLRMSERRYRKLYDRYRRYRARHPGRKPTYYESRRNWM